jgi:hypothetical protein
MEIQTFFLALEVRQHGPGSYTAVTPCVSQFSPPDGEFPLRARLPYLMLLRRSSPETGENLTLRFNLIDEDGHPVGAPSDVTAAGSFPDGHKCLLLAGHIAFEFPSPGCYRLDITADEEVSAHLYSYDLDIGPGSPQGEGPGGEESA